MADQKLLFELRKLNPGVSDKDLMGAVAEATKPNPSKVQQALSPSILQKDRKISAIDKLRLANPGVDDEDLIDHVAIETNKPVSQVRKALGMSDTKLNEFQSKSFGERALGVPGDLLGLNSRGASVFDSNKPGSTPEEDLSFPEQQARKERQKGTTSAAARILKNAKPKSFEEMSRSEREAFKAEQNKPGFFDTVSEVGADIFTPEGFSKVEKSARKFPRAIGSLFTDSLYVSGDEADYLSARGEGRNFGDVAKSLAAGSNDLITSVLSNYENFLGGRELLATFGLTDPSSMPSQMFKREADALAGSMSEVAKLDIKPRFSDDGSLVNIDDRGSIAGVAFNFLRSAPIMLTTAAVGMPLAAASLKGFPAAAEKISPLAKSFISRHFPTLAPFLAEGLPFASISAVIESGLAGADTVEKIMKAPERELLGNREYLQARIDGVDEATARKALAQAASIDAAYQNAAAAFAGGIIAGGGIESMLARFAAGKVTMSAVIPKLDGSKTVGELAKEAAESRGKFIAKEAAKGALSEGVEEGYVSGQQKLIENDIERRYLGNRSIDPNEGLWGATAEGGLVGLMSGTALGGAFAAAKPKTDELTRDLDEYKNAKSVKEVIDIARSRLANSTTKENIDKFLNDRFEEQVLMQLENPELQEAAAKGEDITGKIWDALGGENNMFGYTHDEFQQKLTDIAAQDPEAAATGQPVDEAAVTGQPVDEAAVTGQPVDEAAITGQPVDEAAVTGQPVDEAAITGQPVDEATRADAFNARMDEATAEERPTVTTADGTPVKAFDPPPGQDAVDITTVTPDALPFATRENVTPAQVEARRGLATSLLENLTKRVGGRLLATNISRDLVVRGSSALIGQKVQSPTDLAVVSQVLRDPRFETLRFFFVKDGAIVDHRTFSSRMPTSASFLLSARQEGTAAAAESFKKDIAAAMSDAQADGYYVVHNHPQGSPEPSQGDLDLTSWLGQNVPGFVDHVVINSNEFARISIQDGKAVPEVIQMDFGATKLPPAGNHPLLGASLINADGDIDLGSIAKAATAFKNSDDIFIAYGVNGNGEISTIVELPAAFLNLPAGKQQAYFRAFVSRSGISAVTVSAPTKLYGRLKRHMGDSISFMINHQTGESTQNLGTHPNEQFNKGRPAKVVTEREPVQRSAIEAEKEKAKAPSKSRDDITKTRQEAKAKKEARLKEIEKAKAKSRANRKERREAKTKAEEERAREELQKAIAQRIAENEAKEAAKKKEIEKAKAKAKAKPKPVDSEVARAKANAKANKDTANLEKLDLLLDDLGGRVIGSNLYSQRTHDLIGRQGDSGIDSDTVEVLSSIYKGNKDDVGLLINDKDGKIIAFIRVPTSFLSKSTPLVNAAMKGIYKLTGGKSVSVALHPSGSTIPMKVDVVVNANSGKVVGAKTMDKARLDAIAKAVERAREETKNIDPDNLPFKQRPNPTQDQIELSRGLARRLLENLSHKVGATILGTTLSTEFLTMGSSTLIGKKITSADELAVAAQVLRNPTFESLRIFLMKDGVIIGHRTYTSRNPNAANFATHLRGEKDSPYTVFVDYMNDTIKQTGADGYYVMHNHPTGVATPSEPDIAFTMQISKYIPGMISHVIINSNQYSNLTVEDGKVKTELVEAVLGKQVTDGAINHPLLGRSPAHGGVVNERVIAEIASEFKHQADKLAVFSMTDHGMIKAMMEVPSQFIKLSPARKYAYIRQFLTRTGGRYLGVAAPDTIYQSLVPFVGKSIGMLINTDTNKGLIDPRNPEFLNRDLSPIQTRVRVVTEKGEQSFSTSLKQLRSEMPDRKSTLENLGKNAVAAAMRSRTGLFGDRKVFINHVWRQMERDGTTMGLTFDQFKFQLGLAMNKGFVDLSRADLAPAMDQTDVRESETSYLNAQFHFVMLGGTDAKFKHPFAVEQVTDLERAIAKAAAKATTEGEKKKGIKRVNTADMAKIFPHKDGSLAKLKNVDVLVDDKPTTGAAAVWDGDNIVLSPNGKSKDEISQILEDISKKILTERKEALARLRKTEIPTGEKAADLTPEQQAKNQIAKSKALVDFYLKVKPLADLQNVAPSMQHLIPLSKRIQASKVKTMPDLTKFEKGRMDYQDYMLAWKMLQGSNIVDFELDATTNVYQQENLGKALAANDIEDFHKQVQDGVIKYMKDNDIDPKVVADYLFYLHVPEANAQIQKLWNDPRALAAGITDAEAEAAMKKLEAKAGNKMGAIREAGKQWQDIAKETGQMLVDSGRISKEKHAAMTAVYKNYVPLRGNQDDSRVDVRRKGHEKREDEFILENIVQMREAAIIAIERNRLNGILANFIAKVRNDNIGTIARPTKVATIKNQTVYEVRSSGKDGAVLGIFEDRDDAALFMDKYDLITNGNAIIKPTKEERAVMMAKPKLAPNEIVYYDNGEAIRIQINNDSLKRGIIDGADKVVEGTLVKLSAQSLRLLTKVYTSWNLEFSAVNMVRDLTGSPLFVLGEKGFFETLRVLGNYPRAIATLLVKPNDSVVQQFRKYGGNIGAAYLTDLERVQSDLKSEIRGGVMYAPKKGLGALGKVLSHLNGASENALRLAVMMEGIRKANALRESGGSDLQIETMLYDYAQLSKDLMNFNRKGLKSNNMNATFIFFNAGMQGTQVVAHAIMRSKHKKQVWSAISGAMIISMFASLAAMGAFEDDEEERIKKMMEYKSLDGYSKHRNLTVGDTKIPLAYGFSVFHSIAVAMAEMAMGLPMDKTAIELAESAWLNFVPISAPITTGSGGVEITPAQSLPTLLGILMAPQVNQDTFGRAIVPKKYDQSVIDAKTMTNAMKDSPYEWAAMALNKASGGDENRPGAIDVSPNTLNFFARTFTGGTGSGILNMGTVGYLYYKGAGSTVETSELPFARKFSAPEDDVRKSRSRFFDVKDTMQKEISRFKRDVKDEKVTELADQLFSPEEMKEANRISKAAKALKEEAREINNDKSLTVLQRRIQTKELELQELQLYNDFLVDFQRKYGNKF